MNFSISRLLHSFRCASVATILTAIMAWAAVDATATPPSYDRAVSFFSRAAAYVQAGDKDAA
jgi:hypothetical protein